MNPEQRQAEREAFMRKSLNAFIRSAKDIVGYLTPNERIELWGELKRGYCGHCGEIIPEGKQCNCTREE